MDMKLEEEEEAVDKEEEVEKEKRDEELEVLFQSYYKKYNIFG